MNVTSGVPSGMRGGGAPGSGETSPRTRLSTRGKSFFSTSSSSSPDVIVHSLSASAEATPTRPQADTLHPTPPSSPRSPRQQQKEANDDGAPTDRGSSDGRASFASRLSLRHKFIPVGSPLPEPVLSDPVFSFQVSNQQLQHVELVDDVLVVISNDRIYFYDILTRQLMYAIDAIARRIVTHHNVLYYANRTNPSSTEPDVIVAWDIKLRKITHIFKGHQKWITSLYLHDKVLYSAAADHTCRSWNVVRWNKQGFTKAAQTDSTQLSSQTDQTVSEALKLWESMFQKNEETLNPGKLRSKRTSSNEILLPKELQIYKDQDAVTSVAICPNRKILFTASPTQVIRAWCLESNACVGEYVGHTNWVYGVKVQNGVLYSSSKDYTIRAWDIDSSQCTQVFETEADNINTKKFFVARGLLFVTCDTTVKLFSISTGKVVRVLEGHSQPIRCTAYSEELNQLFTASADGTVRRWKYKKGHLLAVYKGHSAGVNSILIDEHRRQLYSAGQDGMLCVWDLYESAEMAQNKPLTESDSELKQYKKRIDQIIRRKPDTEEKLIKVREDILLALEEDGKRQKTSASPSSISPFSSSISLSEPTSPRTSSPSSPRLSKIIPLKSGLLKLTRTKSRRGDDKNFAPVASPETERRAPASDTPEKQRKDVGQAMLQRFSHKLKKVKDGSMRRHQRSDTSSGPLEKGQEIPPSERSEVVPEQSEIPESPSPVETGDTQIEPPLGAPKRKDATEEPLASEPGSETPNWNDNIELVEAVEKGICEFVRAVQGDISHVELGSLLYRILFLSMRLSGMNKRAQSISDPPPNSPHATEELRVKSDLRRAIKEFSAFGMSYLQHIRQGYDAEVGDWDEDNERRGKEDTRALQANLYGSIEILRAAVRQLNIWQQSNERNRQEVTADPDECAATESREDDHDEENFYQVLAKKCCEESSCLLDELKRPFTDITESINNLSALDYLGNHLQLFAELMGIMKKAAEGTQQLSTTSWTDLIGNHLLHLIRAARLYENRIDSDGINRLLVLQAAILIKTSEGVRCTKVLERLAQLSPSAKRPSPISEPSIGEDGQDEWEVKASKARILFRQSSGQLMAAIVRLLSYLRNIKA